MIRLLILIGGTEDGFNLFISLEHFHQTATTLKFIQEDKLIALCHLGTGACGTFCNKMSNFYQFRNVVKY